MQSAQENARVVIEYDYPCEEEIGKNEPPFVIGVLADFSQGNANYAWESRKFIQVDRDNFWAILKAHAPGAVAELASRKSVADQLPMPWLALHRLVHEVATGYQLKIRVLDVSKTELSADLASSPNLDESHLFRLVYENEYGMPGGEPLGLLVADLEIDSDQSDLQLLAALAEIAARSATPLVAAPSCRFFGLQNLEELTSEKLTSFEPSEDWKRFREHAAARFVSLAVPRFALLPNVYASAGWLFAEQVAASLSRWGWPACIAEDVEQAHSPSPLPEVEFSETQLSQLAEKGLTGLAVHCGSGIPKNFEPVSCAHSRSAINEVLCATMFVRTVSLILRDHLGCFQEDEEVVSHVQAWLNQYVADPNTTANASKPLRAARIAIRSDDAGTQSELTVQFGYQFESQPVRELSFLMRHALWCID